MANSINSVENTPSANGRIKSRALTATAAGPSQQNPPRSKSEKINSSATPNKNVQTSRTNYNVTTFTTIVFFIAVADVMFVWNFINASIGGEGDKRHNLGAEAGLHHLHEKKRRKQVNDHITEKVKQKFNDFNATVSQNEKIAEQNVKHSINGSKLQPMTSQNENRVITVNTDGDIIGYDINKISASIKKTKKKSSHQIDERIAKILKSAKVEVDEETASQLPTWEDVVSQYGAKPIIYGLETCEQYRKSVKPEDRMTGPAGIFNTGTNLLFQLMKENCDIEEAKLSQTHMERKRNGMRWQAPWGKHNPPSTHRLKNVAKMWGTGINDEPLNQTAFFPVLMIKDPYSWMGSECRHQYQTWWDHSDGNCPNLIDKHILDRDVPVAASVKYALQWVHYKSLIDVWNTWYEEYEKETFPMLRTRYEDLLFHGEEVTKIACDCVGGVFAKKGFKYIEKSAKENGMPINEGAYGLVKALLQYGDSGNRLSGMTDRDRWYASKALNSDLMRKYSYAAPPLPT